MRHQLFIAFFLLLAAIEAVAQGESRFYAQVEPTEAAVGDPVRVSFILENGKGTSRFSPPDWEAAGFALLASSQSSSISMMNGETSVSASYNYTVTPIEAGARTIPSVSIKNGSGELHTDPVVVQALPSADGSRPGLPKRSPASPPQNEPKKRIKTVKM